MASTPGTSHHGATHQGPSRRRTHRAAGRIAALAVAGALALAATVVPAHADLGPSGAGPDGFETPAPANQTAEQLAVAEAIGQARRTGQQVAVDALTTETSSTVATPAGRLATTDTAQPVRTRRDGGWSDLDATLHRNPDGSVTPAVAMAGLTLSGGGNGPMATLTTDDGARIAVTAPFPLPAPVLKGATATYADVLPEVDLQVTALPAGGWRNVLVVRTAQAAARPELTTLTFRTEATGLTVSADAVGNIEAKDPNGRTQFHAPAPIQWDSTTTPQTGTPAGTAAKATPLAPGAAAGAAEAADPDAAADGSSAEGPGEHAIVARMATRVTESAIELTPDRNALGKGTGPWYLDPTLVATSSTQGSVEVQENHPGARNYGSYTQLATGFCGYSDCTPKGRQRAYFKIGLNPALRTRPEGAPNPPSVFGSVLNTTVSWAASNGTPTPFGFYWAPDGDINTLTDWGNQPCGIQGRMNGCTRIADGAITGYGPMRVVVTSAVQQAVARGNTQMIIGIAPDDESNMYFRHRFADNPSITTEYDHTPSIWYPRTGPYPFHAKSNRPIDCTVGISGGNPWDNPGWIGSNQNIWLNVNSWSPAGFNLTNQFHLWDDTDQTWGASPAAGGGSWNSPASVPVGTLADGHQYGWNAWATDGTLTSAGSALCYFRVDRTNPRAAIASPDFPPSGTPNDNPTAYADSNATFTLGGNDPAPGGGLQASGLACFRVSTDPTPVTGWHCGDAGTVTADDNGNASFQHVPGNWGTNVIFAQAQDNAGNYSDVASYSYYAPWRPGSLPVFGDVDGDRKADILRPDAAGNLNALGANTDPTRTNSAVAAAAPGNDQSHHPTWKDYRITHRGALIGGANVDQIIAHNTTDPELKKLLSLVYNDGAGRFDNLVSTSLARPANCRLTLGGPVTDCASTGVYAEDWSTLSQLVAIGTPEGERTSGTVMTTRSSLLTVEQGGRLWLYRPGGANELSPTAQLIPTEAGHGDWNDYELINPGPANGALKISDTDSVGQATVWARYRGPGDRHGNVYAYAITGTVNADKTVTPNYSALARPDAGRLILGGSGTSTAAYPEMGSSGDLNGDGLADLWTVDAAGNVHVWRGVNTDGVAGRVDGFTWPAFMGRSGATTSIRSAIAPGSCLDAEGGVAAGAAIALYGCWGGSNQHFNFAVDGTLRRSGLCFSVQNDAAAPGAGVAMQGCAGLNGQKWALGSDGALRNTPSGLCLDLPSWSTAPGARPVLWPCNQGGNQRWTAVAE
ncbi:ricin-type beta-trefoil lectin domain protein [Kitasatospora sp. NPDC059463]|uniref:ricin-type beta-trefoil lectin domain protein n=1 Tax=unclassified Kitasatospora TaxID=2633591 RepID=UPI00368D27B0